jgi:hypothetical protein
MTIAHKYGDSCCNNIRQMVSGDNHQCFMQRRSIKSPSEQYVFFDFEFMQETGEHVVNAAVAQYYSGEVQVFSTLQEFCTWVFNERQLQPHSRHRLTDNLYHPSSCLSHIWLSFLCEIRCFRPKQTASN